MAGLLSLTVFKHNHLLLAIVWIAWAVLLLRLIWKAINWAVDYFVITSQRLILTSGVLTRKVAMMPMSKVTDMSFQRSFGGRLLGYGELIVESAGQNQALDRVTYIPSRAAIPSRLRHPLSRRRGEEPSDEPSSSRLPSPSCCGSGLHLPPGRMSPPRDPVRPDGPFRLPDSGVTCPAIVPLLATLR